MRSYSKRLMALILTLIMVTIVFAACNGGSQDVVNQPTPTVAPEEPTPTAAPEEPTPTPEPIDYDNIVLKDYWADYFSMGAVLNNMGVSNDHLRNIVTTHFNSLTMENEMKPDAILDWQKSTSDPKYDLSPAINFNRAEAGLKFAQENGIKMRGHTLVWHSQTPEWFFREGYSHDGELVSREVMLQRMENYIKQVLEYVQTNYPGVIYAWDVVNEAINPSDGHPDGLRTSLWTEVVGDDFIEKAFEYARKYADPDVKLFYNDYNTEEISKVVNIKKLAKKLLEQGTIDGIGMQTHIGMEHPSLSTIDTSVRSYAELDLELQITELDVGLTSNTEEDLHRQAIRYKRLFLFIKQWVDSGINITNVTFWGTTDNRSWLNKPNEPNYPLLFDSQFQKKPAYYGVIMHPDIPLR